MILLCFFFAPVWALEGNCLQQTFIGKSRERHPKNEINCNMDTDVENRWRGELIYEEREGDSGIKIKWKLLVQKPDCPAELKFFVNDRELKSIFPQKSESQKSDWIELNERCNFELKVQAQYYTDPKCFEATETITLNKKTDPVYNVSNAEAIDEDEKPGEVTLDPESDTSTPGIVLDEDTFTLLPSVIMPVFDENGKLKSDENGTVVMEEETTQEVTTSTNSPMSENMIRTKPGNIDENDNTTQIAAGSVSAIFVVLIIVVSAIVGRKKCRSGTALEQEDIDENRVYGIYSDDADDDDYIVMQDTCPDYEPADVI